LLAEWRNLALIRDRIVIAVGPQIQSVKHRVVGRESVLPHLRLGNLQFEQGEESVGRAGAAKVA
jgi:hypothetical protein